VGVFGSNPNYLLGLGALAVLVIVRFASLVLGNRKPEAASKEKRKATAMTQVRSCAVAVLETAWALGVGTVAGLPLLT
jgi:hypothetical protein